MDYYLGKLSEEQLSAYARGKLQLAKIGVTTFIPGFYLGDKKYICKTANNDWASQGLHGETTKKLFAKTAEADGKFDWNKAYSVTPLSIMVQIINEWLQHPETFPVGVPVIVCSDRQYRRWELRNMAILATEIGGAQPPLTDKIYSQFPHALTGKGDQIIITDEIVESACIEAASIVSTKA